MSFKYLSCTPHTRLIMHTHTNTNIMCVVTSTVEKLLQLVPIDESEREFPSLQSTVQRSLPPVHFSYQVKSPNVQPERSASGPVATSRPLPEPSSNATWQNQQRGNRRLQGPTHIPPAANKRQQQQKSLTGNEGGGGINVAGGHGNVMLSTAPQRVLQKQYQQTHQSKAYGQTNLGKGTAPGNQRRAGGGTNMAGVHNDNVPLHGQATQQKQQVQGGFYQLGGSAVNSMPALNALEPSSYFYHQALQPQRTNLQQQQQAQQQLHHQYQIQPQSHSHSQFQPPSHSQAQAQAQYRAQQQQQQQQQQAQHVGTGNGMYGYSGMRPNDPFLANWMNSSRPSDFSNATNTKNSQFYATLPPGQHQNWPNVVSAGGKAATLQQYQQLQEHRAKTQNPNPLPYSTGGYPVQTLNNLLGNQSDHNLKPGWPVYSAGGTSSSNSDERGKMDAISVLLQPERSLSSSNDFGRYGHIQSEPSLSKLQTNTSVHHGHNRGDAPGNKVDPHNRKTGAPVMGGAASTVTQSSKGTASSEVKGDGASKKLIILRGLPGSGKTTLARYVHVRSGNIKHVLTVWVRFPSEV